jgi:hypothetical protein
VLLLLEVDTDSGEALEVVGEHVEGHVGHDLGVAVAGLADRAQVGVAHVTAAVEDGPTNCDCRRRLRVRRAPLVAGDAYPSPQ